jgi:DNA-binding NarL/FixJ family response regulator
MVVEGFKPFRRFVCSKLKEKTELQVICEVSDGLEAVHKAKELKPDLILLDIGLSTLNGIEAARRILALVPESKIIMFTPRPMGKTNRFTTLICAACLAGLYCIHPRRWSIASQHA